MILVGVKCSILEKNKGFSNHPQAHFINNRTMEVDFLSLWKIECNLVTIEEVLSFIVTIDC